MNQTELANLMLSLGAYNAANLDGGVLHPWFPEFL